MEQWLLVVQNFGLATAILGLLGFGAWKTLVWVGREVVIPARDRLIGRLMVLLDSIEATMAKMAHSIDLTAKRMEDCDRHVKNNQAHLEAIRSYLEQLKRERERGADRDGFWPQPQKVERSEGIQTSANESKR